MSSVDRPAGPQVHEEPLQLKLAARIVPGVTSRADITGLLRVWRAGDENALERLVPLVYDDLRRIAHRQLRCERTGHTLSTTALVHEAYLRLADQHAVQWTDRAQFFALAARIIRRVLVDHARQHGAAKRGGARMRVALDDDLSSGDQRADLLLALDEALVQLAAIDPRAAQVVECRFFGGFSEEETASALGITARTVRRDWVCAKAWLGLTLRS